jgi:predicted HTH transcriptional regulator
MSYKIPGNRGLARPESEEPAMLKAKEPSPQPWTFLTNHAHVLICISADPEIRGRDLADRVGITERAVQRIIADLVEAGHLARFRAGRRNRYEVRRNLPLRHPVEAHCRISALLDLVSGSR